MGRITQQDVGPVKVSVEAFGASATFNRAYNAPSRDAALAMLRLALGSIDQDHPQIPIHEYRIVISQPRQARA